MLFKLEKQQDLFNERIEKLYTAFNNLLKLHLFSVNQKISTSFLSD